MATISTFKRDGNGFTGPISTMTIARKVRLVRSEGDIENARCNRLFSGKVESGAARIKTSREGKFYVSAKLDDPSFPAVIFATLI